MVNLYRPPTRNIENFVVSLENSLSTIDFDKFECFVMGDFNLNLNDRNCGNARSLKTRMMALGLIQLINNMTRVNYNSQSCIDLIFTNCDHIQNSGSFPLNISDHDLVYCTKKRITVRRAETEFIGRSYRNFYNDIFINLLNACNWNIFDNCENVLILWEIYIKNIREAIDLICPLKQFKVKTSLNPWITNEILEEIKDKDNALRRAKRTKRQDHWLEARLLRNRCLNNVRKAKADFIKEKLDENKTDSKNFWNTINSVLPGKNKSLQEISLTNNGEDIAKSEVPLYMNDYFSNIGAILARDFGENDAAEDIDEAFPIYLPPIRTNELELLKLIKELNISKSSAIDHLSTRVLKQAFSSQLTRLVRIFNFSFHDGLIPDSWKCATVIPLHKGGDNSDVNNFRPVSLLPIQGKLIEKIVHDRFMSHFENNRILDHRQGGFRKNHSTTNTSIEFINDVYKAMNDGKVTIAVFIDLRKAFDTVNHKILCSKLQKYGISGTNLSWVENYLLQRTQKTLVNNTWSDSLPISCGVPQGSVLGPLLFLVYVNNMSEVLNNTNYCLYADDTVLYQSGDNVVEIVNSPQNDLNNYSNCNPLYRGAMLWNSLSVKVRNIEEFLEFKRYLKDWAYNVTMLNNDWEYN